MKEVYTVSGKKVLWTLIQLLNIRSVEDFFFFMEIRFQRHEIPGSLSLDA